MHDKHDEGGTEMSGKMAGCMRDGGKCEESEKCENSRIASNAKNARIARIAKSVNIVNMAFNTAYLGQGQE